MSRKGKKRKLQWQLWDEQATLAYCATRRKEVRSAKKYGTKEMDDKDGRYRPLWANNGKLL